MGACEVEAWLELAGLDADASTFGFLGTISELPLFGFDGGHVG